MRLEYANHILIYHTDFVSSTPFGQKCSIWTKLFMCFRGLRNRQQMICNNEIREVLYVEQHLIRQRPHFIADFLIRSIIGNSTFNDYPKRLTNTHSFNDYFGTKHCKSLKAQENRCGNTPQRLLFMWLKRRKP